MCRRTCEGLNFRVTVYFCASGILGGGKYGLSLLKWPRGELVARCREQNKSIALT